MNSLALNLLISRLNMNLKMSEKKKTVIASSARDN